MTVDTPQRLLEIAVLRRDADLIRRALAQGANADLSFQHLPQELRCDPIADKPYTLGAWVLLRTPGPLPEEGSAADQRAWAEPGVALLQAMFEQRGESVPAALAAQSSPCVLASLLEHSASIDAGARWETVRPWVQYLVERVSRTVPGDLEAIVLWALHKLAETPHLHPARSVPYLLCEQILAHLTSPSATLVQALDHAIVAFSVARRPLLHVAASAAPGGRSTLLSALLKMGCDPNRRCASTNRTALMQAGEVAALESVQTLLAAGADLELRCNRGWRVHGYLSRANDKARARSCTAVLHSQAAKSAMADLLAALTPPTRPAPTTPVSLETTG